MTVSRHVLVVEAAFAMDDLDWCLPAVEASWDLSMLLLTLVPATGRLTLARGSAAAAADAFVVCGGNVGERGEDGGVAGVLGLWMEEW